MTNSVELDSSIASFTDSNGRRTNTESDQTSSYTFDNQSATAEGWAKALLQDQSRGLLTKTYDDFVKFRKIILINLLVYMYLLSVITMVMTGYIILIKRNIVEYMPLLQLLIAGLLIQVISIFYFITKYVFSVEEFKQIQDFAKSTHKLN